jgi:alkylated DNA repair protein alkB homolog 8
VWPKVRAFLETFGVGDVIADVGCGNGKYFGVRRGVAVLGSDRSVGLAEVAAQRLASASGVQPRSPALMNMHCR